MSQIARSMMGASEETLESIVNTLQEEQLRTRKRNASAREARREVHRNPYPKKPVALHSVAAPGVPFGDTMRKTWFREMPNVYIA